MSLDIQPSHRSSSTTSRTSGRLPPHESLADIAKRLKKLNEDRDVDLAREVCKLADSWHLYRGEAGGLTCNSWLVKTINRTKPLAKYRDLLQAADTLGASLTKNLRASALLWLAGKEPEQETLDELSIALCMQWDQNGQHRLTEAQVKRTCAHLVTPTSRREPQSAEIRRLKAYVSKLQEQLRAAGMLPVGE